MFQKAAKPRFGQPSRGNHERLVRPGPQSAQVDDARTNLETEIVEHRRCGVGDLNHLGYEWHRARLEAAKDHVLGEAEELIEILVDSRLGDEGADVLLPVDDAVLLKLGERSTDGFARRAVPGRQLRLGWQTHMRPQFVTGNMLAQRVRDREVRQ